MVGRRFLTEEASSLTTPSSMYRDALSAAEGTGCKEAIPGLACRGVCRLGSRHSGKICVFHYEGAWDDPCSVGLEALAESENGHSRPTNPKFL
jgi:hypothetical protein